MESGIFKGGRVIFLEEGRTSWDLGYPSRITMHTQCLGGVGRFWFSPCKHGVSKIRFVL